jgi:hypothetical protein
MQATLIPTVDAFALWHRVQDHGGFTVDPRTGEVPASGYAVSLPGFERVYPRELFRPPDVVHALQDARQAGALYPEHRTYAGAWLDTATNLVYTDASVVLPARELAEHYGIEWGQLAYYDIAAGVSINLPASLPAAA